MPDKQDLLLPIKMKTLISLTIIILLSLSAVAKSKRNNRPHQTSVPVEIGITIHLPSDGAFQFYAMKQCGGTPSNPDNYVEWDHEIWPSGCYPSLWSRAAYGYVAISPIYNPNWFEWIPANDLIERDFTYIAPSGFWTVPTYNYASVFTLCGDYIGEFLPQLQAVGYPANATYWVDFDSSGVVRVAVGSKPFDWDNYLIDGSPNLNPRTEGVSFIEDASALPNLCP